MQYFLVNLSVYVVCFALSFWALSSVQFEKFTNVQSPGKVHMLLLLSSLGLGYIVAQFLLGISIFNAL